MARRKVKVTWTEHYDCSAEIEVDDTKEIDEQISVFISNADYPHDYERELESNSDLGWRFVGFGSDFWGNVDNDVADDVSLDYEKKTGKSSVIWIPSGERHAVPSTELDGRPEEYETCGFTSSYEQWGQNICNEAVNSGCTTRDEVINYIRRKLA